eukprot:6015969-Amphidinium_carterae.1
MGRHLGSDISHLLLLLFYFDQLSSQKRNENGLESERSESQESKADHKRVDFLEFGSVCRGGGCPHNGDTINKSEMAKNNLTQKVLGASTKRSPSV